MKTAIFLVLRVMALTVILFVCFAVSSGIVAQQGDAQAAEQAGSAALTLLFVCLLDTCVLSYFIIRSRSSGWRLMAIVCFVFYGVMTFMSQIESAVFLTHLPPGMLPRLFLMGALIAIPFSVLAVIVLGKKKGVPGGLGPNERLVFSAGEWVWKVALIALIYVTLYFTFGYFIAWRNPSVLAYYAGIDEGSFFAHMITVIRDSFWLIPFQMLRGILWAAIALPVIRTMKGGWPEAALALGLIFAVVMNAQLLIPNPYMPEPVRMAHLAETASSNFIFGVFVGWLLTRRHRMIEAGVAENGVPGQDRPGS